MHGKGWKIAHLQQRVSKWLRRFQEGAEQLGSQERWRVPPRKIFEDWEVFNSFPGPETPLCSPFDCRNEVHYFENAFPWQRPWLFPPEPLDR
jgi:hypothetical protein